MRRTRKFQPTARVRASESLSALARLLHRRRCERSSRILSVGVFDELPLARSPAATRFRDECGSDGHNWSEISRKDLRRLRDLRRSRWPPHCRARTALAERIAEGDQDARNELVRANLRLVAHIARGYSGRGIDPEDLVSEGYVGLITAAERFDPRFNTRFSTYASYWIKQAIRHALCNTTAMIRLPVHAITLLNKWRRTTLALERALGRVPRFDEVADAMNLPEGQRRIIERRSARGTDLIRTRCPSNWPQNLKSHSPIWKMPKTETNSGIDWSGSL